MKRRRPPASLHARPWLLSMKTGLSALAFVACARESEHPPWQCNDDFVCDPDENQEFCPSDCVWKDETGEGPAAAVCDAQENWTFVQACLGTCGNDEEDDGETLQTCPATSPGRGEGVRASAALLAKAQASSLDLQSASHPHENRKHDLLQHWLPLLQLWPASRQQPAKSKDLQVPAQARSPPP